MNEPFAIEIYKRFLDGETVQALSAELEIPEERIVERLRAAAAYTLRRQRSAA